MANQKEPSSSKQSSDSRKWLVRFLLIIGIGIPVLIELFTFSGLITGHLGEDAGSESSPSKDVSSAQESRLLSHGDVLYDNDGTKLSVKDMKLQIYPDYWNFTIEIMHESLTKQEGALQLTLSHLVTQDEVKINKSKVLQWDRNSSAHQSVNWRLNTGQRPELIQLTLKLSAVGVSDSTILQKNFKFGHVPARYQR